MEKGKREGETKENESKGKHEHKYEYKHLNNKLISSAKVKATQRPLKTLRISCFHNFLPPALATRSNLYAPYGKKNAALSRDDKTFWLTGGG